MATIHFLNVLEGDCNIIQHDSGRTTVIDVSNAYNDKETDAEKKARGSIQRETMRMRTQVPASKRDFKQKLYPDNPIEYLKKFGITSIFRFIITHPDMDHLDGIKDLYEEFNIGNTWDTNNNKEIPAGESFGGYNPDDWKFYRQLRSGSIGSTNRLCLYDSNDNLYWKEDRLKILCPSPELVKQANETGDDYHDLSYVLLFTYPKTGGGVWKIVLSGDSHDSSWDHILKNYKSEVSNVDVLFAPHHGRDSDRDYAFLDVLKPKVTLFGNADSQHLAYDKYPDIRLTNNQAGYVVIKVTEENLGFYVKNFEFAKDYRTKKGWGDPQYYPNFDAYGLFWRSAK